MKTIIPLKSIFILFVFLSFLSNSLTAQEKKEEYIKGTIRVKLTPEAVLKIENGSTISTKSLSNTPKNEEIDPRNTGIAGFNQLNTNYRAKSFKRVFRKSGKFEARHKKHGFHLWYEIKLDTTISMNELITQYGQLNAVELVESKVAYSLFGNGSATTSERSMNEKPNDPLYQIQWHYENNGQTEGTPGADINLEKAWGIETGNPDVIVAIIDGGIDVSHEDLKENLWINEGEVPDNNYDDDGNGYVDDYYGWNFADNMPTMIPIEHGTHVAGTVAAQNNNGIGVAGVAGGSGNNDGVRLMACQVFSFHPASGEIVGGFEEAFVYAADNGAVISNNSWGGGSPSQLMEESINYFIENGGKDPVSGEYNSTVEGGLPIFAAGNYDAQSAYGVPAYSFPSVLDQVVCVANIDHNDVRHISSYFNRFVDISAPGTAIYSTLPGNRYGGPAWTGTSMASPHVTGVAALIASKNAYNISAEEIKQRMYATAKNIDHLNPTMVGLIGVGSVDAYAALVDDAGEVPVVADWGFYGYDENSLRIGWELAVNKFGIRILDYDILVANGESFSSNEEFESAATVFPHHSTGQQPIDGYQLKGLEPKTTYTVGLKAKDLDGNVSEISELLTFTTWEAAKLDFVSNEPLNVNINVEENPEGKVNFSIVNSGDSYSRFNWLVYGFDAIEEQSQTVNVANFSLKSSNEDAKLSSYKYLNTPQPKLKSSPSYEQNIPYYQFTDSVYHETNSLPDEMIGSGGANCTYANKFVAEKDMKLTHVGAFIATEMYKDPSFSFAIYVGGEDAPMGEPEAYTEWNITDRRFGAWFYTTLSHNVEVKAGETFWVTVGAPYGLFYPMGADNSGYNSGKSFVKYGEANYYNDYGSFYQKVLKIRAYESSDLYNIARFDPKFGVVEAGKEQNIGVTVDGNNLPNGNFRIDVTTQHDDPKKGLLIKPINVSVSGHKAILAINKETIDFKEQFFVKSSAIELEIKNTGKGELENIALDGLDPDLFTITPSSIASLKAGYKTTVKIATIGQSVENNYQGVLDITSNAKTVQLPVLANFIQGPVLESDVASISWEGPDALESGAVAEASFTLTNTGNYPAIYDFEAFSNDWWTGFLKNLTPYKGVIEAGESQTFSFEVDMEDRYANDYGHHYTLMVEYNNGLLGIPVKVMVVGEPIIEIETANVDFGSTVAGSGEVLKKSITISNTGTKEANLIWGSLTPPFAFEGWTPYYISPENNITVNIKYSPSEIGVSTQDLTFEVDGNTFSIPLTGEATASPAASLSWDSDFSEETVEYNTKGKSAKLSIANSSEMELTYSLYAPQWIDINDQQNNADGLDNGYGYSYKNAEYEWIEISEIGTSIKENYSYYDSHKPYEFTNFVFPYFGKEYKTLSIGSRGFLSFDPSITSYFGYSPQVLPSNNPYNAHSIIAPFWGSLALGDVSDLYVYETAEYAIIQWTNMGTTGPPANFTFQTILYADGRIKFQYKELDNIYMYVTVGFEGPKGNYGLSINKTTDPYIHHLGQAIEIMPPVSGTIAAGESSEFKLQYNGAGLLVGDYTDMVRVHTNDVNNLETATAVSLTVTGESVVSMAENSLTFNELMFKEGMENTQSQMLTILNEGSKTDTITDFTLSGDVDFFDLDLVKGMPIPAFNDITFTVYYKALDAEIHNANVIINTKEGSEFQISLHGDAYLPPVFEFEMPETGRKDTIDWVVNENAEGTYEFSLFNTGIESEMNFDVSFGLARRGWDKSEEEVKYPQATTEAVFYEKGIPILNSLDFSLVNKGSKIKTTKAAAHTPAMFADSIAYDLAADTAMSILGLDEKIQFQIATKFEVKQEDGFFLTHVKQFIRREQSTQPIVVEILKGEDIASAELLLAQNYEGGSEEGAMDVIALNEQFYFEKGSIFFVKIILPDDISYPIGVDYDVPSVINKYFISMDNGENWNSLANEIYYTYALKTRAMSASYDHWLSIEPAFGNLAANQEQAVKLTAKADKLEIGEYKAYLYLAHNDPHKKMSQIPVNLRINEGPLMTVPEKQSMKEAETLELQIPVTDPEDDAITSVVPKQQYDSLFTNFANGQLELTFKPNYEMEGDYTFTFVAKDEYDAEKSYDIVLEVLNNNRAPEVIGSIDSREYYEDEELDTVDLDGIFSDPDGEMLTYSVLADDPDIVNIYTSESAMVIQPQKEGITNINIKAYDPEGLFAETSFKVTIATITGIDDFTVANTKVYPIPTLKYLNIVLGDEIEGGVNISILNLLGVSQFQTIVDKGRGEYTETIDISNLPSGIYLVNIRTSEDVIVKKIIKK